MKRKSTAQPATKADIETVKIDVRNVKADVETLAVSTAKEFVQVHRKIDTLNEKMDTGFADTRQEMREGFRMVLAAIETV